MPKRTLRDLFAVVTIVALALGWGVDHWRMAREVRLRYAQAESLRIENRHMRRAALAEMIERAEAEKASSDQPSEF
jgi:hypothetical protein